MSYPREQHPVGAALLLLGALGGGALALLYGLGLLWAAFAALAGVVWDLLT